MTALWYLALVVSGVVGYLVVRGSLFVGDDPVATAANLVEREWLARLGVAVDLTIVVSQALAALWFFRLFRHVGSFAAASLAAFGSIGAVAMLVGTVFSAAALSVATGSLPAPGGDMAATVQLLYGLNDTAWSVGGVFFGLWLFPMGHLVRASGTMSRVLGWLLMGGGACYMLSTYVGLLLPDLGPVEDALLVPATVGEFWIIGALLRGVRVPS